MNFDLDSRGKCQGENKQLVVVIKLYQAQEGSSWWIKISPLLREICSTQKDTWSCGGSHRGVLGGQQP